MLAGWVTLLVACKAGGAQTGGGLMPATDPARETDAGISGSPVPAGTSAEPQPEAPCLTGEELNQLGLAERAGLATLCYRSADGVETTIEQAAQIAGIRAFLGDPDRLVAFREIAFMPNSPDGRLRTAMYEDERGVQYYYAVAADKVVEMTPGASSPVVGEVTLSESELRAAAEALVARELPEFETMKAGLTASGGQKSGGLYFYRWEAAPIAGEGSMPPLAQVGITASGEVFSYINTLYFLK